MKDICYYKTFNTNGLVAVDFDKLGYPISKNTHMIWVNGKKIPSEDIQNITATQIVFKTDPGTIHNVAITKYIDDYNYLKDIFRESSEYIPYTVDEVNAMGYSNSITDNEGSFYGETYPIKSVMWEILRDFFIENPYVDITEPFIYDYLDQDTDAESSIDDNGIYIREAYNPEEYDSIKLRYEDMQTIIYSEDHEHD